MDRYPTPNQLRLQPGEVPASGSDPAQRVDAVGDDVFATVAQVVVLGELGRPARRGARRERHVVVQDPVAPALAAFDTIGLGTTGFDGGDIAFIDELRLATSWLEVMACPALALFADDFESTDTSAWSTSVP